MKFMNLADEYSGEDSNFVILPIEYEGNVTYGKGAALGASEILKASAHLEYYDEQFDNEPFEKGIKTAEVLNLKDSTPEDMVKKISDAVSKFDGKFLIGIGGDHSVTIGTVKGLERVPGDFDVIMLDAHPDMFHSWNDSQLNHRCTAQRLVENHKILSVGIRSMDKDENDVISDNANVDMIKAYDFNIGEFKDKLGMLGENVFISIDVDVFDPSFIRNTGTPEPGGLSWNDVVEILKAIFEQKKVIGADIVEFAPKVNFEAEAFSLAKLCYKLMSLSILK